MFPAVLSVPEGVRRLQEGRRLGCRRKVLTLLDPDAAHPFDFYVDLPAPDIELLAHCLYAHQATSVASEGTFGQGRRTHTRARSSLKGMRVGRLIGAAMRYRISKVRMCRVGWKVVPGEPTPRQPVPSLFPFLPLRTARPSYVAQDPALEPRCLHRVSQAFRARR